MAGRIRSIKPEVLEDELAAALPDDAWRLWVSLWVLADDHGNVRAGNQYLAATVWQDTSRDASKPLAVLIDRGFLSPYAVQAQRYAHINGWSKHQRVDNAGKPRVPLPSEDDGTWDQQLTGLFAYSRANREEPGEPPPRAYARTRIPAAGPPISDHDHDPERDRARAQEVPKGPEPEAITALPDDFELTDERRAYAELVPLTDVPGVFRKFKQIAIQKRWMFDRRGWEERWKQFADDEKKYQRKDRDKAAAARPEVAAIPPPRMTREERERRERDRREAEQARREGWEPKLPPALHELLHGKLPEEPKEPK